MERAPVAAFIGLGANLGDAVASVRQAMQALARSPGTRACTASRLYRSVPLDAAGPDFINAVVRLDTTLTAPALLQALQAIEAAAGRHRPARNAPRTLDLDLLLFGTARIDSARLTVPHPRWHQRAFVLRPLAELAPKLVSAALLQAVADQACEPLEPQA